MRRPKALPSCRADIRAPAEDGSRNTQSAEGTGIRRAYGRTAASPKPGVGSLGLPKRMRTGFVARLCARRPGGCRCCTRSLAGRMSTAASGARGARRSRAERLSIICYLSVFHLLFLENKTPEIIVFQRIPAQMSIKPLCYLSVISRDPGISGQFQVSFSCRLFLAQSPRYRLIRV